MKKNNQEKACNYCKSELPESFVLMADAEFENDTPKLPDNSDCCNGYCNLFCLMKDLVENIETSHGQTIN